VRVELNGKEVALANPGEGVTVHTSDMGTTVELEILAASVTVHEVEVP
jgi:hypothetical protein